MPDYEIPLGPLKPRGDNSFDILRNALLDLAARNALAATAAANRKVDELAPTVEELGEKYAAGRVLKKTVLGIGAIPGFVLDELLFSAKTGGPFGSDVLTDDDVEKIRVAWEQSKRTGQSVATGVPALPFILPMWTADP